MIRSIIVALITCIATIGGIYGAMSMKANAKASAAVDTQSKLQMMKTRLISVPLLANGEVFGYIVTRLNFLADGDLMKLSSVTPDVFVADEAFRQIYENTPEDMKNGRKQTIKELTANIAASANKRIGREVVKDVMIESWTYLSKQDMMKNHERS